ncbi:MAG TPA: nucleotidyltransferase family protein [Nitrososphaerales archaeon]|nr:nucleotidyltransferase family protein [Nitrososphaerales archaeon]
MTRPATSNSEVEGIVLAAGLSRRMGAVKMGLTIVRKTLLEWALEPYLRSELKRVILVLPEDFSFFEQDDRLSVVRNPRPQDGLSSSLKLGLAECLSGAAVIGLGDQPMVRPETIDSMVSAHQGLGAKIVVPVFSGKRGNPVLFDRALFPQILAVSGDVGAKQVITANEGLVLELDVQDDGILVDVDTPGDLEAARARLAQRLEGESGQH